MEPHDRTVVIVIKRLVNTHTSRIVEQAQACNRFHDKLDWWIWLAVRRQRDLGT